LHGRIAANIGKIVSQFDLKLEEVAKCKPQGEQRETPPVVVAHP
jgi:hypothetical protein